MRLLAGFLVVVAVALAAQSVRPQCSMTEMRGVEWVECLTRKLVEVAREGVIDLETLRERTLAEITRL